MVTVAERVAAGVDFLNANDPGWWREDVPNAISLRRLNLRQPCDCVLGQREGSGRMRAFWVRAVELGLEDEEQCVPLGFEATGYGDDIAKANREYAALTDEWRRVIADLRVAAREAEAQSLLAEVGAEFALHGGAR